MKYLPRYAASSASRNNYGMRPFVSGLVLIALLAACGSSGQSDKSASPTTDVAAAVDEAPVDPMEVFFNDAGELPLEAAKAVFAATFAPLPGVTAAEFDGDLHGSSYLLRVLLASKDQLTGEQLAVIEQALGPIGPSLDDLLEGAGARAGMARDQLLRDAAAVLRESEAYYAAELGRSLPFLVRVAAVPEIDGVSVTSRAAFSQMRQHGRWMAALSVRSG